MKIPLLLFTVCVALLGAPSYASDNLVAPNPLFSSLEHIESLNAEIAPLFAEDDFVIHYAFAEEKLEASLKEAMIKHFEKLGTVHSGDDTNLTEKQKQEKYRVGGGLLHVIVSPIIEENLPPKPSGYTILPVLELSLKIIGGAESLSNKSKFCCPIWENTKFLSSTGDKKLLTQKAVASLDSIVDSFIADYQKANPGKKPQFFLDH